MAAPQTSGALGAADESTFSCLRGGVSAVDGRSANTAAPPRQNIYYALKTTYVPPLPRPNARNWSDFQPHGPSCHGDAGLVLLPFGLALL